MQHCKREYCNAGTRQWSQRGIYIRKASKAKNSEQIIIRSNDSRYRGYPKTEKNAIQQRGVVTIQEAVTGFLAEKENTIKLSSYLRYEQMLRKHILPSLGRVCVDQLSTITFLYYALIYPADTHKNFIGPGMSYSGYPNCVLCAVR